MRILLGLIGTCMIFSAGFVTGCWWYVVKKEDTDEYITNMKRSDTGESDCGVQ